MKAPKAPPVEDDAGRYLRTDHLQGDLAVRSARSGAVNLVAQFVKTAATIGTLAILGRLLRPDDFGVVAIALATAGILGKVKDAGLSTATIQRADLTHGQASTLFWVNVAICTAVGVATVAIAPGVAWFYGDSRLGSITCVVAVLPFVDGLAVLHEAVLKRQMRFASLAIVDAASLATGFVAAVVCAWRGAGYWALVAQEVVYSGVSALLVWATCRWRPGAPRRGSGVRPLVGFGLNLSGFRVLDYAAMNLDTVFVGRFWGAAQAGVYDRSFRLFVLPMQLVNGPLTGVAVATLSRLQHDPERYRAFYRKGIQAVFAMTMPMIAFLFVDAERAIVTVLGSQWLAIVPIYRVLALAVFFGRFNVITNWVFVSTGRADRQLRWSAFLFVPMVIGYAIGVWWGAIGVAAAQTLVLIAMRYPGMRYCFATSPVRPRDVFEVLWMPALASTGAGALLFALMRALPTIGFVPAALALDLVLYCALYATIWVAVPSGRRSIADLVALARLAVPGGGRRRDAGSRQA